MTTETQSPTQTTIQTTPTPSALLKVQQLQGQTPLGEPLFEAIDWSLRPGELWVLRGPNGVGKSTLLKIFLGIHPYFTGQLDGPLCPSEKVYLPQITQPHLAWPITLGEVLGLEVPKDSTLTAKALELKLITPELLKRPWAGASGGERQRLLLLKSLQQPEGKLLLLDEPFNHLDERSLFAAHQLLQWQIKRGQGVAALISCHNDWEVPSALSGELRLKKVKA